MDRVPVFDRDKEERAARQVNLPRTSWNAHRSLLLAITMAYLVFLTSIGYLASDVDRFPGEEDVSTWVQSWRATWLDHLMKGISAPGFTQVAVPMVALAALLLFLKGMRKESLLIPVAVVAGQVINSVLKVIIARPRPGSGLVEILHKSDGFAFPSGHVVFFTLFLGTLAVMLAWNTRPCLRRHLLYGTVAFVLIAVGVSRVYLGAHWAGDVMGAYAFGAAGVATTVGLWRLWIRRDRDATGGSRGPFGQSTPPRE